MDLTRAAFDEWIARDPDAVTHPVQNALGNAHGGLDGAAQRESKQPFRPACSGMEHRRGSGLPILHLYLAQF